MLVSVVAKCICSNVRAAITLVFISKLQLLKLSAYLVEAANKPFALIDFGKKKLCACACVCVCVVMGLMYAIIGVIKGHCWILNEVQGDKVPSHEWHTT